MPDHVKSDIVITVIDGRHDDEEFIMDARWVKSCHHKTFERQLQECAYQWFTTEAPELYCNTTHPTHIDIEVKVPGHPEPFSFHVEALWEVEYNVSPYVQR